MKRKFFLLLTIFACTFAASAQKKQPQKDSTVKPSAQVTDTTALLSIRDLSEFDNLLKSKFTINNLPAYQELLQWLNARVSIRVKEYEAKTNKK